MTPAVRCTLAPPTTRYSTCCVLPVYRASHSTLCGSYASALLAQGVHPRVIMEALGHSQIALTMNTYAHVIPQLQREAAEQMDALLG